MAQLENEEKELLKQIEILERETQQNQKIIEQKDRELAGGEEEENYLEKYQ